MSTLVNEFTSTGSKLYWHQEAMQKLRDGQGMPISAWVAGTDLCNAKCAFCSVGERVGDVLPFQAIRGFIDQLAALGLKAVTFSGGGNFLLYKCPETKIDCNGVIEYCHKLGLPGSDHRSYKINMVWHRPNWDWGRGATNNAGN